MSNVKIKLLILIIIKICASNQNENFKCVIEDGSCNNSSFPDNLIDNFNASSNQITFNSIFISKNENFTISDVKYKKLVNSVAFVKAKNDNSITNLEPCTSYTISSLITDVQGMFDFTYTTEINTTYEEPNTQFLMIVPFSDSISVHWNSSNQGCVKNYKLNIKTNNSIKTIEDIKEMDNLITDLDSCSIYEIDLITVDLYNSVVDIKTTSVNTSDEDPGPVNKIKIKENMATSVLITWESPETALSCIEEYTIKTTTKKCLTNPSNCIWTYLNSTSIKNEAKIISLQPCTDYVLYVYANGRFSDEDKSISFRTAFQAPGLVTSLSTTEITPNNITVTWEPPIECAECVQYYKITWNDNVEKTTETFLTLLDLEPCENYTIYVSAVGENDEESDSSEISADTETDKPSAIHNFQTELSAYYTYISWDVPVYGGKCIDYYRLAVWIENQSIPQTLNEYDIETAEPFYNFTDMTSCYTYSLQIIPVTFSNMDGNNEVFEFETAERPLIAPHLPELVSKTKSMLELSSIVRDLTNECSVLMASFMCENTITSKSHEIEIELVDHIDVFSGTIEELSAYTYYRCTTRVYNLAGWSDHSASALFQTEQDLPGIPINISATSKLSSSFTVNWSPPEFANGPIIGYRVYIYGLGPKYFIPEFCEEFIIQNESFSVGGSTTSYSYNTAEPFTEYMIQISAENTIGVSEYSDSVNIVTLPSKSSPLNNFNVNQITGPILSQTYEVSIALEWKMPCRSNGNLKEFSGFFQGVRENREEHNVSWTIPFESIEDKFIYISSDFKPEYSYMAFLTVSVNDFEGESDEVFLDFTTPAGIPFNSISPDWGSANALSAPNPTANAFVSISRSIFDCDMGDVLYIALLISERNCQEDPEIKYGLVDSATNWPDVLTWIDVAGSDCIKQYQTTNKRWIPSFKEEETLEDEQRNLNTFEFLIGSDTCTSSIEFCNGPLKQGTPYSVTLRIFTKSGYADSTLIQFQTDNLIAVFWIIMIVVSALLMSFIIGLLILWRTKKFKRFRAVKTEKTDNEEELCSTDVSLKKFLEYYKTITNNSNDILIQEFKNINLLTTEGLTNITAKMNEVKNRYTNIYPYDTNRVLLETDDNESDYINASFIKGYKRPKEYIATQGPKPETCSDFWNMILQYKVEVIIMLTQLKEGEKLKCHQYYPAIDTEVIFNDISVKCIKESEFPIYKKREISINNEMRIVQYHFTKWPDHDCPKRPADLINFIKVMHSERKSTTPIVVHCSAGVGRTGTLIGLDIIMQRIKDKKMINIFGTVKEMRLQRVKMVQTVEQYHFLYKCVLELIKEKSKKVLIKNRKLSFIPEHEEDSIKISEIHSNGTTMVKSFSPQDDIESAM